MAICLALFPPSTKFYSYLDGYINKNFQDADWKEVSHLFAEMGRLYSIFILFCSWTNNPRDAVDKLNSVNLQRFPFDNWFEFPEISSGEWNSIFLKFPEKGPTS